MPPKKTGKATTVLDKIVCAIRALNEPQSSRAAITKYIKAEFDYNNTTALKAAFKRGVSTGILEQTGQSFRVAGDPVTRNASEGSEGEIQIINIKDGKGEKAESGDVVTVSYVGRLDNFDDGYEFDKANSFTFVLGAGDVIKGWDQGVDGMRVGEKRKLVVPSKLGYGKRGCKPDIPPCATLYFEITLKRIKPPQE